MTDFEVLLQQLLIGLTNGMIIALIALGYTMVYGIVELVNFAHGDLFMLGSFFALTLVSVIAGSQIGGSLWLVPVLIVSTAFFCGCLNWAVDRFTYRSLRDAPRLVPLVAAIGMSFIFINIGLFWGGLPLDVFNLGRSAAAPKDFPSLLPMDNLFGESNIFYTWKEFVIPIVTIPLMALLTWWVQCTKMGKAMRAVAQDQTAAKLMGIDVDKVIGLTFFVGGALAGVASVIFSLYNNTISFQMGFRAGMDAFAAAVLGGIGSLPGAVIGGLVIGVIRSFSDQYVASQWTNIIVFSLLIAILIFKPTGLLGKKGQDKV